MSPRKVERVEPVGTCYLAKSNLLEFTEYSPCRTSELSANLPIACFSNFTVNPCKSPALPTFFYL
uniref:Uncharacterized protein n=1 Tax=Lutzomyia longipalpis TaxID=7200 RepID=A0A1B0CSI5_LUTLO